MVAKSLTLPGSRLLAAKLPALPARAPSTRVAPLKTAAVRRGADLLTKELVSRLTREVRAAILEELTTRVKYMCFRRRSMTGARNVMNSRHVVKWKPVRTPMARRR